MALLQSIKSGTAIRLKSYHTFGRSKSKSTTYFSDIKISKTHASIRYSDNQWQLIDHSRNGIWLNGNRLTPGEWVTIKHLDKIGFQYNETHEWLLTDDTKPESYLESLADPAKDIVLTDNTILPDTTSPEITLHLTSEGRWTSSDNSRNTILKNGDIIKTSCGSIWRLHIESPVIETQPCSTKTSNDDYTLSFNVSMDEEHVTLNLKHKGKSISLGERVHHYLLLILARKKLEDAQLNYPVDEQGWLEMSDIEKIMGVDCYHINIQIFRLRKQVKNASHLTLPVIDRRCGSIRFSGKKFTINKNGVRSINYPFLQQSALTAHP